MGQYIAFVLFIITYITLEAAYFSVSIQHHKKHFADIQCVTPEKLEFNLFPYGILAYFILVLSMWYLIFDNGRMLQHGTYSDIMQKSTMYALVAYTTYNLTNMVVLRKYRLDMLVIDSLWGIFVVNMSTTLVFFLYRHLWKNKKAIDFPEI